MDKRYFSNKLAKWYETNKRQLPWRETSDPYRIWLSEVILQQTRVVQGLPYYLRFVERFADVGKLAAASEQEVLRLWQGLGYYSRARNLHRCAKEVVQNYGSRFPETFSELRKLRGIGDYTAAAIASISFGQPVAVVDGNVYRVLSRVFGLDQDIASPSGKLLFSQLANELIPIDQPAIHNQAVMEFGALHCTPRNPKCDTCIFATECFAATRGLQSSLPVKSKLKRTRNRYFYYAVVRKGSSLLMGQRSEKDIWQGLYDFALIETPKRLGEANIIAAVNSRFDMNIEPEEVTISQLYKHILTHQRIFSRFIVFDAKSSFGVSEGSLKFYSPKKIAALPKPALISRFLDDYNIL
ncbi:A/G-specific adenine glycosylase [Chryseolinea sp. T2]|uniref:A/G-specific adenine glycosylase n=1 Tax=Chryseolinea sp. T2 TaxID=3129255 RepID=UPI0030774536